MAEAIDFSEYAEIRNQETSNVGEVSLSDRQRSRLKTFLDQELSRALGERALLMQNFARWQEAYNAPKNWEPKDFPVANASNLTLPVIKEVVNTLHAQLTQTTLTPTPIAILETVADEWTPFTGIIERFMDRAAKKEMDVREKAESWVLEAVKLGTSVLQTGFREETRSFHLYNRDGVKARKVKNIKHMGPRLWHVPIKDYIQPFTADGPQDARWCGKRFRRAKHQLIGDVNSGYYERRPVASILDPETDAEEGDGVPRDEVDAVWDEMQDTEASESHRTFEIYELFLAFDLDQDGEMEELIVHYHHATGTILRVTYNQFWHMRRPFTVLKFFPVEHRFYGQGICEMLEPLQEEISTMHNQRIDATTLATTQPILVRRSVKALKPGDPIYSSQIIPVDDTSDVEPLKMGSTPPMTVHNENISRQIVERLSGVNEANMRGGQPTTRTTATAQLALLQEQAKRFDQVVRNIRAGISEVIDTAFWLYFQFGVDEQKVVQWLGERGRIMVGIFGLPFETVRHGLGFKAAAPSSQANKELQRQNAIAVLNLVTQVYTQLIEFYRSIGVPPQALIPVAKELSQSTQKFLSQILDRFDVTNPDDIISGLRVLDRLLPAPEDMGGSRVNERTEARAREAENLARLEGILSEVEGLTRGG